MSLWNIHTEPVDAAVDLTASGDTTLVASSSTSHNYIFNISVVVAAPTTITLKCGSRTVAKYTLQANATMSISAADYNSGQSYFTCRPGEAFILNNSSAVGVTGTIKYASQSVS